MLMLSSRGVAGLGASSPAITSLQNALIALAQASGRPAINPGAADGILGPKTMNALAAGLQAAAEKIPKDSVATAVSFALTLGATTTQAINTVNSYAPQLTLLIKSATAAYVTGVLKPLPTTPGATDLLTLNVTPIVPGAPTPWYKTWWGIGGIAIGAVALYLLLAPKKAPAATAVS